MRRFIEHPSPTFVVRGEPPFAVLTGISLATLYLYYNEGQNEAIIDMAKSIREDGLTPSADFNAIFGEGFGLRDSLALLIDPGDSVLQTWSSFMAHLESQDTVWWRSVAEAAIHTGLDFAGDPIPAEGVSLGSDALVRRYAAAVAIPDLGAPANAIERILSDPGGALKVGVLETLHNLYPYITAEGLPSVPVPSVPRSALGPDETFVRITAHVMPPSEADRLRGLDRLIFLASPWLGAGIAISYFPVAAVISFDPGGQAALPERDPLEAAAAFDALSNIQRLRILQALAERVEMYGVQISEELDIPQATVSNHLAVLQTAGLIGRRPTGRRVYYSIAPVGIERAEGLLRGLVSDDVQKAGSSQAVPTATPGIMKPS